MTMNSASAASANEQPTTTGGRPLSSTTPRPWYRQPWLWFILAPLLATFAYLSVFVTLAVTSADGLVHDDYRKEAKQIELDQRRDALAQQLGLSAQLHLDSVTGDIRVILSGIENAYPEQLKLEIIHPTQARGDLFIDLRHQHLGSYVGALNYQLLGKRHLNLIAAEPGWRLSGEARAPFAQPFTLSPRALY